MILDHACQARQRRHGAPLDTRVLDDITPRAAEFARRDRIILFGTAARGFQGKRPHMMHWFAT